MYDLQQKVIKAKAALQQAKKDGKKGKDLKPYEVDVKNAETVLAVVKKTLGGN
jgi:uncharacterized cupredoxin-like copper-binding protein